MKLAFVIKTLDSSGGAERVLTQVTSELARHGHEINLLTFGRKGDPDFYPVDPAIGRVWLGVGNVRERSGVIDFIRQIRLLRREILRLAPDAAVGFMHSGYVPLALALSTSSIPVVASEHISYDHFRTRPLEAILLRAAAPFHTQMTAVSEAIRGGFPRYLGRRMMVLPNPVAPVNCMADTVGGCPKLLLNVGRLTEQKDQRTLVEAFARTAPAHPDWILRIVGEGNLRRQLERVIAGFGLQDRVQLAGVIEDMEREYCSAQLFAVASRYESFGLAT